jgi:hypothetical protein
MVRSTVPHGPRSGPFHGSARDGSARSIFGWTEDRPTVGLDRNKARDGPWSGHGPVQSDPERIAPSGPFQNSSVEAVYDGTKQYTKYY